MMRCFHYATFKASNSFAHHLSGMSWSVVAAVLAVFSSHWRLVAGTVVLAVGLQVLLSWMKKRKYAAQLWQVIKDIPDQSTVMKGSGPFSLMDSLKSDTEFGNLVRVTLPDDYLINAVDPEYAKCILAGVDKKTNYNWQLLRPYVGDGVLSSQGAKWFRNRKLLTPAFHFGVLKDYFPLFQECLLQYMDKWSEIAKNGHSVEVAEDIDTMTLKALLKCAFGDFPLSENEQNDIQTAIRDVCVLYMKRFNRSLLSNDFLYSLTQDGQQFFKAIKKTRNLALGVIREKQRQQKDGVSNNKKYKDFLDIITEARDEDGNPLSEEELIDEVQTFFFAGHDTTASAIPYVLYNLAKHPEYQEKCRNEIEEVCDSDTILTGELIGRLQFLNMCVKESLRLHPPVWGINRKAAKPITLPDGRTLPADCSVGVSIYAIMHKADIWEKPFEYDPYRFHPDNAAKQHPYAFIPFSAGSRNCIGMNFALSEIRVSVASILRRFRISLDPEKPLKMCLRILLKTEDGLWLKLQEI